MENGSNSTVKEQVQSLGTDVLTASISSQDYSLEYEDMDEVLQLDNVEEVAPYKTISATVSRGTTTSSKASIIATNDSYLNITNVSLASGRSISIIDIENKSKVCILGNDIAEDLFNLANPIGENIKLNGDNYTVIGVLKEQGSSMGTNSDSTIIIPITTAKHLGEDTSISNFYIKVSDENKIDFTTKILESFLRNKLQVSSDYFSVSSQDSMIDAMESIDNTLSLLLGGIASISLVVGGIGIMNVMLVSVTERTKEIGIRKSLGAKKINILVQFLVEALVLSVIGGIIGILTGLLIGNILENFGYTFENSNTVIVLAFSSSALIRINIWNFSCISCSKIKTDRCIKTGIKKKKTWKWFPSFFAFII